MAAQGTGWVEEEPCLLHEVGGDFPERPARLQALRAMLVQSGLEARLVRLPGRAATEEEVLRLHSLDYLQRLKEWAAAGYRGYLEPSTPFMPRSLEAALWSAGCALAATEAVLEGRVRYAFSAGRPPGHHARPRAAMGFCFFNNVALAADLALRRGLERVAIVDWDVHHGNGTQEMFYADPRVLFVSVHQAFWYPGTGWEEEVGEGPGRGFTANFPLLPGQGDEEYLRLFRGPIAERVEAYRPQMLLVSAGYDAHAKDPLGRMELTDAGFGELTATVKEWAEGLCEGRLVLVLEGGYDLEGLCGGVRATLEALLA